MQVCKICTEKLKEDEKLRGTCRDCENIVVRNVMQKILMGHFPKRLRAKR